MAKATRAEPRRRRRAGDEGPPMKRKSHRGSKGSSTSNATWHPLPVRLKTTAARSPGTCFCARPRRTPRAPPEESCAVRGGGAQRVDRARTCATPSATHFGEVEEASLVVLDMKTPTCGRARDVRGRQGVLTAAVRGPTPLDPPTAGARGGPGGVGRGFPRRSRPARDHGGGVADDGATTRKRTSSGAGGRGRELAGARDGPSSRRNEAIGGESDGVSSTVGGVRLATAPRRRPVNAGACGS